MDAYNSNSNLAQGLSAARQNRYRPKSAATARRKLSANNNLSTAVLRKEQHKSNLVKKDSSDGKRRRPRRRRESTAPQANEVIERRNKGTPPPLKRHTSDLTWRFQTLGSTSSTTSLVFTAAPTNTLGIGEAVPAKSTSDDESLSSERLGVTAAGEKDQLAGVTFDLYSRASSKNSLEAPSLQNENSNSDCGSDFNDCVIADSANAENKDAEIGVENDEIEVVEVGEKQKTADGRDDEAATAAVDELKIEEIAEEDDDDLDEDDIFADDDENTETTLTTITEGTKRDSRDSNAE